MRWFDIVVLCIFAVLGWFFVNFLFGCSSPITLPGVTISGYGVTATVPPMTIPAANVPRTVNVPVTIPPSSVPSTISGQVQVAPAPAPSPTPKTSFVMPHHPQAFAFLPFHPDVDYRKVL